MKKILLASTILALSAPLALAEVTVSGDGRMGVTYTEDFDNADTNELAFSSRIRIVFTASGETDGGLAFGGTIRADNAVGGAAGTAGNVFISGAFGRLTMGDVAGAAEFVVGDLAGVGFQDLGSHHENTYLSNNRRSAARYEYTTGGLTFAVSADNPGTDGADVNYAGLLGGAAGDLYGVDGNDNFGVGADEELMGATEATYALGVRYTMDAYTFSLGYETTKIEDQRIKHIIAGVEGTFSGVTLKATYGQADGDVGGVNVKLKQMGLSASYTMDALTVRAYHRQEKASFDGALPEAKFSATGIGASYNLGGGASLVGGIVQRKISVTGEGTFKQNLADLGVTFTF